MRVLSSKIMYKSLMIFNTYAIYVFPTYKKVLSIGSPPAIHQQFRLNPPLKYCGSGAIITSPVQSGLQQDCTWIAIGLHPDCRQLQAK